MEPSFEQEPAEKQHQTTCAAVSENGVMSRFHLLSSLRKYSLFYRALWCFMSSFMCEEPRLKSHCSSQIWDAGAGSGQDRGPGGGSQNQPHLQAAGGEGGPWISVTWQLLWGAAAPTAFTGAQTRQQHSRARYTSFHPLINQDCHVCRCVVCDNVSRILLPLWSLHEEVSMEVCACGWYLLTADNSHFLVWISPNSLQVEGIVQRKTHLFAFSSNSEKGSK